MSINTKSGTSLFEVLVALVVIGITLIALMSIVTQSISNSTFSRNRTRAAALTTEASEWIRAERDTDWQSFYANASAPPGTEYCLRNLSLSSMPCGQIDGLFQRTVRLSAITVNGADAVEVIVVTSWNESDGRHESRITTTLTNWRLQ